MADLLYPARLYWENQHGFAKCDGERFELKSFPPILGLEGTSYMDCAPGTTVRELRRGTGAREEMTDAEVRAVSLYLKLASAAGKMAREAIVVAVKV